jgi:outer membrane immunogenic protein
MLRRLRPVPVCAVLVLASSSAAFAADLEPAAPAYKAPVYKAPVMVGPYNWTGFYVGGNAGYGWGHADNDIDFASGVAFPGVVGGGGIPAPDPFPAFAHSDSLKLNGPNGGGQIGYNWQFARTGVVGIEADFQATNQKSGSHFVDSFSLSDHEDNADLLSGTTATDQQARISWFGTVRGRLGYAFDNVLLYGTGGLAYGKVGVSGAIASTETSVPAGGTPATTIAATNYAGSSVNVGWTAGAGIEGAIAGNWTWKAEYLHLDLGSVRVAGIAPTGVSFTAKSGDFTDDIVRVGVNYRFGPAVAHY